MPAEDDLEEEKLENHFRLRTKGKFRESLDDDGLDAHEGFKVKGRRVEEMEREDPSIRRRWTDGVSNDSTDLDVRHLK